VCTVHEAFFFCYYFELFSTDNITNNVDDVVFKIVPKNSFTQKLNRKQCVYFIYRSKMKFVSSKLKYENCKMY
jgi:hypothetical protein